MKLTLFEAIQLNCYLNGWRRFQYVKNISNNLWVDYYQWPRYITIMIILAFNLSKKESPRMKIGL